MKFGYFTDRELPEGHYRCPSWDPMPEGKKMLWCLDVLTHTAKA